MAEQDQERLATGTLFKVIALVFALLAATLAAVGGMALYFSRNLASEEAAVTPPDAPRISPHPAGELTRYVAEQRAHLERYGWVDRERGYVHIPVDEAMARYAKQAQGEHAP